MRLCHFDIFLDGGQQHNHCLITLIWSALPKSHPDGGGTVLLCFFEWLSNKFNDDNINVRTSSCIPNVLLLLYTILDERSS